MKELKFEQGTLVDLDGSEVKVEPLGEPTTVVIKVEGYPDFSERVRRTVVYSAPSEADAFVVGRNSQSTTILEKKLGTLVGMGKQPKGYEPEVGATHPIQFYRLV